MSFFSKLDPFKNARKLNNKVFGTGSGLGTVVNMFSSNPIDALDPTKGYDNIHDLSSKAFGSSNDITRFIENSPANIKGTYSSLKTAISDPKAALAYIEDHGKNLSLDEAPMWFTGDLGNLAMTGFRKGENEAKRNAISPGTLSDEDIYRHQTETTAPSDNPFEAKNYDAVTKNYGSRGSPRVYSTDTSFVFPDTPVTQETTGYVPGTGEPAATTNTPAPAKAAPIGNEVTKNTATPGANPFNADNVAKMFQLPGANKKRSASVVN